MSGRRRSVLGSVLLVALGVGPAAAHDGPPYPILVDRATGPVLLSVWADPDVGTGTFHVYLEPLADQPLPEHCAVEILVQPVDGRLLERGFTAEPLRRRTGRQHHLGEVEFDAVGEWTARFVIDCRGRRGEAGTVVEVTPPGQGPVLDFLLYLFPFVAIGALVVRALVVGRRGRRSAAGGGEGGGTAPTGDAPTDGARRREESP